MNDSKRKRLLFCLRETRKRTFIHSDGSVRAQGSSVTLFYDSDMELVDDFNKAFPGRLPDCNLTRSKNRLANLLREFFEEGWFDRSRLSNHDLYDGEPKWQYVYFLTQQCIRHLADGGELESWVDEYNRMYNN